MLVKKGKHKLGLNNIKEHQFSVMLQLDHCSKVSTLLYAVGRIAQSV
jgi:hypothetical protein